MKLHIFTHNCYDNRARHNSLMISSPPYHERGCTLPGELAGFFQKTYFFKQIISLLFFLALFVCMLSSVSVFSGSAIAKPCFPYLLGSYDTPHNAWGVTVSGTTAYVADGISGLQIVDVTNPTAPQFLGSYDTPGTAYRVAISGATAYVADGDSGLQIIDVTDPTTPHFLGSYDTPGVAYGVAISGDTAFVADGTGGLQIIDITDRTSPHLVGNYDPLGTVFGIALSGDTAFVANDIIGLMIIDVTSHNSPKLLKILGMPGHAAGLVVSDTTAYIADWEGGFQIADVSDPLSPALLGGFATPASAVAVAISGTTAYVAEWYGGLQIIDVSDPSTPKLMGSYETPDTAVQVALSDTTAYISDGKTGLLIIDVTNLSSPNVGSYDTPGNAMGIALAGTTTAFVADGDSGLQIIDITNNASPMFIGSYDSTPDTARGITLSGSTTAFMAYGGSGIQIIDTTNPTFPVPLGSYNTPGTAYGIAVSGTTTVFVADGESGLQIIDATNPNFLQYKGSYDTPGIAYGVAVSGTSTVFVADGDSGLQIINATDPTLPVLLKSFTIPGTAYGVAISDSTAYVAAGTKGLLVIDITNPALPKLLGSYDTPGFAMGVTVNGTTAFVSDGFGGLQVIDVTNPALPKLLESYDSPGNAGGVAVSGNTVCIADGDSGLQIVEVSFDCSSGPDNTPPTVVSTNPLDEKNNVAINTIITATFSESIDEATISGATFTINNGVTGSVAYNDTTKTATFTPSANLSYSTSYTATITTGVKDLAGNPLNTDYMWNFTTETEPDKTPPTVISTNPLNNAINVATSSSITATFSEPMDETTINDSTFTVDGITGIVGYNHDTKTATFTPSKTLNNTTSYKATITTGVIDKAGNPMSADYMWSFTTESDITPPTVVSTSPLAEENNVAVNTAITATFSESIDEETISDSTFTINNGVTGLVAYDDATKTATFTPSANLSYSTSYTATITTEVKDMAGNPLSTDYVWNFTTEAEPDKTPPAVISTKPSNNAINVAISSSITATFSEPVDETTINDSTFTVNGITGTVSYNPDTKTATFTPSATLNNATSYTATITTGVVDKTGNPMTADYTWGFTTLPDAYSWITNPANGHLYKLIDGGDWHACENDAVDQGAHLVTINNKNEQKWLFTTFRQNKRYWIGYTDEAEEGNWKWVSGESSSYTNWNIGQPSNSGDCENYSSMKPSGKWDDVGLCSPIWSAITTAIIEKVTCEAEQVFVSENILKLKTNQKDNVTVMITDNSGCQVVGIEVKAKVGTLSQQFISISPQSGITNDNGQTVFTITAKDIVGKAKVIFSAGALKKTFVVKVMQ